MPPIATDLSTTDELIEVRAMIARLKRREAQLALMVELGEPAPVFVPRPGWPIARAYVSADLASH
ncbi:MAG: hypothetical protein RLZZ437_894 [Pseudomonadota bacterium]|jgi:hypothetical protein